MNYPVIAEFEGTPNGHANRRDPDAEPRVLLLDISPCASSARLHFAGDPYMRAGRVYDIARDTDTLSGMHPLDAFRIGAGDHDG